MRVRLFGAIVVVMTAGFGGGCPTRVVDVTGLPCANQGACAAAGATPHFCDYTDVAHPENGGVCMPDFSNVATTAPDRPPVGQDTLIIAPVDTTALSGKIVAVDPDGQPVHFAPAHFDFGALIGDPNNGDTLDVDAGGTYTLVRTSILPTQKLSVSATAGEATVDVAILVAVVGGGGLVQWTGAGDTDWNGATNWQDGTSSSRGAPSDTEDALVAGAVNHPRMGPGAGGVQSLFVTPDVDVTLVDDATTLSVFGDTLLAAGPIAGGVVHVLDQETPGAATTIAGVLPEVDVDAAAAFDAATHVDALRAPIGNIEIASGTPVVVAGDADVGTLTLDDGASVDVGGTFTSSVALAGDATRATILLRGDTSLTLAGRASAFEVHAAAAGPQHVAIVGSAAPAVGTVVVESTSAALFGDAASYGTLLVDAGGTVAPFASSTTGVVNVDTLVLATTQHALAGARGTLRATHCQLASQALDWPTYIDCGGRVGTLPPSGEGEGEGAEGEGAEGEGAEGEGASSGEGEGASGGEGEGASGGEGEGASGGEGEGASGGEGEGASGGEGEGSVGEGEGEGGGDISVSIQAPVCPGTSSDAMFASSTVVVTLGNSITQTLIPDNGESFSAGAAITSGSGAPIVAVIGGDTIDVNASGAAPGSYGIGVGLDDGTTACVHVHVVDPSLCSVAVQDGVWNDSATWGTDPVPTATTCAYVPQGVTVTTPSSGATQVGELFVEDGGTVFVPVAAQAPPNGTDPLFIESALISAGTINCAAGGQFSMMGVSAFVTTSSSAHLSGNIGRIGSFNPIVPIGSIDAAQVQLFAMGTAATFDVGAHRLRVDTFNATGGVGGPISAGLLMQNAKGVVHATSSFSHNISGGQGAPTSWVEGRIIADGTFTVGATWPASGPSHTIEIHATTGATNIQSYQGVFHIFPTAPLDGPYIVSGVVSGKMILERTATTGGGSITFPSATLERDIAGAIVDPTNWRVTSVGGHCTGTDPSACPP